MYTSTSGAGTVPAARSCSSTGWPRTPGCGTAWPPCWPPPGTPSSRSTSGATAARRSPAVGYDDRDVRRRPGAASSSGLGLGPPGGGRPVVGRQRGRCSSPHDRPERGPRRGARRRWLDPAPRHLRRLGRLRPPASPARRWPARPSRAWRPRCASPTRLAGDGRRRHPGQLRDARRRHDPALAHARPPPRDPRATSGSTTPARSTPDVTAPVLLVPADHGGDGARHGRQAPGRGGGARAAP